MPSFFGKRPDIDFPLKTILDGTEEAYSQAGGVLARYNVDAIAAYIGGLSVNQPFNFVNTEGDLPTGVSINTSILYVVRDWSGTGKSRTVVWDSTILNWRELDEEESDISIVADIASLPLTGIVGKIYHILDAGGGQPSVMRWDDGDELYVTLDQDNQIYEVADLAARDALVNPQTGHISIITDADGSGNPGLSFRKSNGTWSAPFLSGSGGSSSDLWAYTLETANYAVTVDDKFVLVDCSVNNVIAVTLPPPASTTGKQFYLKVIEFGPTKTVSVTCVGGALIDGSASISFSDNHQSLSFFSNGTSYLIF